MPKIEEICAALKVLSEAKSRGELMMAPEVGERLGMTAQHAGPLLGVMYERKIAEKPEKGKNRYQITEKGEEFLANPPKETEVKKEVPPTVPPTVPPIVPLTVPPTPPKEDSVHYAFMLPFVTCGMPSGQYYTLGTHLSYVRMIALKRLDV
jgi:predicted transcriptional regulator